ncbi:MAG: class I SAM-dependent methyltransferase [Anaerolineaceae bacterium]|nr:class I SAM-dependent methyltransferase [Anaerolineaceae bacterium]MCY4105475.1 class I SAM-dependent methyltransferase [Chloroflexota bacterium]
MSDLSLHLLVEHLLSQRQENETLWLQENLAFQEALPRVGGFAAADDFLALIARTVQYLHQHRSPLHILEMGSGISTLVLAQTLCQLNAGRLLSLEHSERFALRTQGWLTQMNLNDHGAVLHAPLKPCPTELGAPQWYDLRCLPEGMQFHLLVIDGPPAWLNRNARTPTLPLLAARMAPHAIIVLDDHHRRGERKSVQKWLSDFPQLQWTSLATKKGTAILQWPGWPSSP